jgi:predicted oxidoreductase (fatty acid repression mutant protein)
MKEKPMHKTVATKDGGQNIPLQEDEIKEILKAWQENEIIARKKAKIDARKEAYGSVEDQLDMLYWDRVNGTEKWKEHIAKAKENFSLGV